MEKKILYIFDLENTQEQYACCIDFVRILEKKYRKDITSDFNRLKLLLNKLHLSGRTINYNGSKIYYEQPLLTNKPASLPRPLISGAREIRQERVKEDILYRQGFSNEYHIRVHMQRNEDGDVVNLSNLRYLALMLKGLWQITDDMDKIDKRISVFIVPSSGNIYPFKEKTGYLDFEMFSEVSQFLRLLAKQHTGIIYGVDEKGGLPIIRALDFKKISKIRTEFPLIPIESQCYSTLFENNLTEANLKSLFSLRKNGRFGYSNSDNPMEAIGSFVVESAFRHIKDYIERMPKQIQKECLNTVEKVLLEHCIKDQIQIMTFVLFGFTFSLNFDERQNDSKKVHEHLEQLFLYASDLGTALSQIAQNALQHSESHAGIMTLKLKTMEHDLSHCFLEVSLIDYNEKEDVITNFLSNLEMEIGLTNNPSIKRCYSALVKNKDKIILSDLFGKNSNSSISDIWSDFRSADTFAHVGLLIFGIIIDKYNGSVSFTSSNTGDLSEKSTFYSVGKFSDGVNLPSPEKQGHVLPGTQVLIMVPIGGTAEKQQHSLGQLQLPSMLNENYDAFAYFLDWKPTEIDITLDILKDKLWDAEKGSSVYTVNLKREMVSHWENEWRKHFQHVKSGGQVRKEIFYFSFNIFKVAGANSSDLFEIILKGFFNACSELDELGPYCFAFINAPSRFMQVLKRLCISLAPKLFPRGLQLYACCENNCSESVLLSGDSFYQAVNNAYQLSMEHGSISFSRDERELCRQIFELFQHGKADELSDGQVYIRNICPFDTILKFGADSEKSIFDKRIEELAEKHIDEPPFGYKLSDTHMRLGSKVHIRSFYEMSFLFYRTTVANRLAFEILADLASKVDILNEAFLFYGYASYSKALLTALIEIVKSYRNHKKKDLPKELPLAIASYQHNLQSEQRSEETEIYFDFSNSDLGCFKQNCIEVNKLFKIIQIVPISSTLTTFSKMYSKLNKQFLGNTKMNITAWINYTVFWVSDSNASGEQSAITPKEIVHEKLDVSRKSIGEKYYNVFNAQKRLVNTVGRTNEVLIKYLMIADADWCDPLGCKLCYPINPTLEIPLVETDQTSTVPTQQIRAKGTRQFNATENHSENDRRILFLRNCVLHGHILREHNHFVLYIDTKAYFNAVAEDLKLWLKKKRDEASGFLPSKVGRLNVIFSPEHNTNVGFAQYVNNYYFGGGAEVVCINEDKQFRSNFKCEHMALIEVIRSLIEETNPKSFTESPVRFFFADDTIVSGETYHKANNFLLSLLPDKYRSIYPSNVFDKCFFLIDRLSKESKSSYVQDEENNFISYVHLDISNIRTHGDSCLGCKAVKNATHLLKGSATLAGEKYWANKIQESSILRYDCKELLEKNHDRQGFSKLVMSHIIQNTIFNENDAFTLGNTYDSLLTIMANIVGVVFPKSVKNQPNFSYGDLLNSIKSKNMMDNMKLFIALISRPFFTFDFKVRLQVHTLLLLFAESIFGTPVKSDLEICSDYHALKGFLLNNGRIDLSNTIISKIKATYGENYDSLADFLINTIFSGLAEMRSTYLIRKTTILKLYSLLRKCDIEKTREYLSIYAAYIQQLLDGKNDETKSLRLEYLLVNGEEYNSAQQAIDMSAKSEFAPLFWPNENIEDERHDDLFRRFGQEVFLQNSRVLFDCMENFSKIDYMEDRHFMDCWNQFRKLDQYDTETDLQGPKECEMDLFNTIQDSLNEQKEDEIYTKLLTKFSDIASKKYCLKNVDTAFLTLDQLANGEDEISEMQRIDIIYSHFSEDEPLKQYTIKQRLSSELKKGEHSDLKKYGYNVIYPESDSNNSYMFVCFEHPDKLPEELKIIKINPVYLYLGIYSDDSKKTKFYLNLLLRDILSYRHRLLHIFEKHFSGRAISKYAHTLAQREVFAHEKAVSHNTTGGDREALEVLQNQAKVGNYKLLDSGQVSKWLLLRNYTNDQIAKLFNRINTLDNDQDNKLKNRYAAPPLYIMDKAKHSRMPWDERPLRGLFDLCLTHDNRFSLLASAALFSYDKNIKNAQFFHSDLTGYYNAEYFRCILIDIIFSAMKYNSNEDLFLEYIDHYLEIERNIKNEYILPNDYYIGQSEQRCVIHFERRSSRSPYFDYFVIWNEVSCEAHSLFDIEWRNKIIKARLRDPLDYPDGHMSLLSISRYVESLDEHLIGQCRFEYIDCTTDCEEAKWYKNRDKQYEVIFQSCLPVLKKEEKSE